MTIWKPDTCDCKIEYNDNIKHVRTYARCNLHRQLKDQTLLDAVISYNQSFNLTFGRDELTEDESRIISLAKQVTKLKIRQGDFSELPPTLPTPSLIERLKNFLGR